MPNTPYLSNFDGFDLRAQPDCLHCESSFTDSLDGTLNPAEERLFELHLASCVHCAELFAEAQRGHAWLEMLKTPRPEPRPELLARILAQTSGNALGRTLPVAPAGSNAMTIPVPLLAGPMAGRLLAFRPRPTAMHRLGRVLLEPRLAMTAAMAFFSITLTMSLTGVRLNDLHASDLSTSSLRRTAHGVQAGAVRYYDNLRVVHVLESRVDDLREDLQQRRQDEMSTPAAPAEAPVPQKPAKQEPADGGGSSSARPHENQSLPVLTSMIALLAPWTLNGDHA